MFRQAYAGGYAIGAFNFNNMETVQAITATIRRYHAEHPEHFDPRQYLKPARENVRELVRHKIRKVFGCSGKAPECLE
jgi:fructose/tagatose bisphosphate aldolase